MEKTKLWPAQVEQNCVTVQITVQITVKGTSNWQELFSRTAALKAGYGNFREGQIVTQLQVLTEEARLNNVSVERTILSRLVEKGYKIDELEVEFVDLSKAEGWGRCVWYKEHDSYINPSEKRRVSMPQATPETLSYVCAMFKTEHCGDQEFTLLSTQMAAAFMLRLRDPENEYPVPFLFHKTIIFRRIVLSNPKSIALAA